MNVIFFIFLNNGRPITSKSKNTMDFIHYNSHKNDIRSHLCKNMVIITNYVHKEKWIK